MNKKIIERPKNISSLLDKSIRSLKSLRSNSTNETIRKENSNIQDIFGSDSLTINNPSTHGRLSIDSSSFIFSNNFNKKTINNAFKIYMKTEPNKSSDIIKNADKILKQRLDNHLMFNPLVKSTYLKNTKEIGLDNYKIRLMKQKRNDLNTKAFVINKAMKSNEKIFEQDYKNFLDFVDKTNNYYKNQEYLMNKYKKLIEQKEVEYIKLNLQHKKLKEDLEYMVRRILTLRYYGSFIHNVFKIDFVYENIKRTEGQSLINVADDIIKTYENNNEKGYDDKLLDDYWLMAQISEFELNIISILNEKESFKKEIIKIEYDDKDELKRLNEQIEDLEERLEIAKEDKEKFMKSMTTYDSPEDMDIVVDCIEELYDIFGLSTPSSSKILKDKTDTSYTILCADIMRNVKIKENLVINHINEIENIINGENKEDKKLIEGIIYERKKEIKKRKLIELLKEQKDELMKKNMKAVERAHRIVIKGRKALDFPMLKSKKRKKKVFVDNNDDDFIYYSSSDEN